MPSAAALAPGPWPSWLVILRVSMVGGIRGEDDPVSWQDFDDDTALERDTLERALPLVETESTDSWGAVLNMTGKGDPGGITILPESVPSGATAEGCIDLLRLKTVAVRDGMARARPPHRRRP